MGLEPAALFELHCFTDLLIKSGKREFLTRVRGLRDQQQDSSTNFDALLAFFMAMHKNESADLLFPISDQRTSFIHDAHPMKTYQQVY